MPLLNRLHTPLPFIFVSYSVWQVNWIVFQVCRSMKSPKHTCRKTRMNLACDRLSLSLFSKRKMVRPAVLLLHSSITQLGSDVPSACDITITECFTLHRMVLRWENAGWRERLVSCELRHGDHQSHRHGEQCTTDEAFAQGDQRLNEMAKPRQRMLQLN